MIEEAYCSYEVAKLLKLKGFNGQYHMYYVEDGKYKCDDLHDIKDYAKSIAQFDYLHKTKVPAPTQQIAMRWLREVHNIKINVFYSNFNCYAIEYFETNTQTGIDESTFIGDGYPSYERACDIAIKYCLENVI